MEPGQLLEQAATFTANHLDCGFSPSSVQEALNTFGNALVPQLRADDEPGIFSPVIFTIDGKVRAGCLLTLSDRALFVWHRGRLRVKLGTATLPFSAVSGVRASTRVSNDPSKPLAELAVHGPQLWTLAVPAPSDDGEPVMSHLANILSRTSA